MTEQHAIAPLSSDLHPLAVAAEAGHTAAASGFTVLSNVHARGPACTR